MMRAGGSLQSLAASKDAGHCGAVIHAICNELSLLSIKFSDAMHQDNSFS
jgi:hypothetical protein